MTSSAHTGRLGLAGLCLLLLATGCTTLPAPDSAQAECLRLYQQTERVLTASGARPSSPAAIRGFPYYRVNRFLAAFRQQELDQAATDYWLQQLGQQEQDSRQIALRGLSDAQRARLPYPVGQLNQTLAQCQQTLRQFDLAHPERLAQLRQRAVVADDYVTAARIVGLYPLFSIPVRAGIKNLHAEFRQRFALPLEQLPVLGEVLRYQPEQAPPAPQTASVPLKRDQLGIPRPDPQQLQALLLRHAPVWEIDVAAAYDRPGRPVWRSPDGAQLVPAVDTSKALTFYYPSYSWWQGQPVLQLNYLIWFDQRPLEGPFDILGGALDGVLWRVTLGPDQQPLLYDSIHACGCYHLFFPTPALRLRATALQLPEPPLAAQTAPILHAGQQLVIRLASATHYLERVYAATETNSETTQTYQLLDYAALYQTPSDKSTNGKSASRNLFNAEGLVSGTERAERLLLWPLGVAEPGAMRERGRHAVAFVGRRHFDDADLLDTLFEPAD